MFPTFERRSPAVKQKLRKKLFIDQLGVYQKQISLYFKHVDVTKSEWVRNPFVVNPVLARSYPT